MVPLQGLLGGGGGGGGGVWGHLGLRIPKVRVPRLGFRVLYW